MSKVIFDISMSLDGFVRAPGNTPEEPLGKGGERLHDWALGDDSAGSEVLANAVSAGGALICGRRNYEDSLPWWGADGPTGSARLPTFVVTHQAPAPQEVPEGGVYTFVTDGVESAVRQAREAAGDKNILVQTPDVAGQLIRAGLVDQIGIHLVPVLFGGGLRLYDHVGVDPIQLEVENVIDTAAATHLVYRIVK